MGSEVEYTDEFYDWWVSLSKSEQDSVAARIAMLEKVGSALRFPYSSGVSQSRHSHMRELRIQHAGRPYRVLYAMDPRRAAILLVGGDKTGNDRWYQQNVPKADALYDRHVQTLKKEGLL
jgi:hypothetical protein